MSKVVKVHVCEKCGRIINWLGACVAGPCRYCEDYLREGQ